MRPPLRGRARAAGGGRSLPTPADWRRHSVRGTGWAGRKAVVLASMPADAAAHAAAFHSAATGVAGVAAITGSAAQLLSRSRARDSAHAQGQREASRQVGRTSVFCSRLARNSTLRATNSATDARKWAYCSAFIRPSRSERS